MLRLKTKMSKKENRKFKDGKLFGIYTKGDMVGKESILKKRHKIKVSEDREIELHVRHGDLTKERVDVIVNAANTNLYHIGGLARAIVKAGGATIQYESIQIIGKRGALSPGDVVSTSSGSLRETNNIEEVFHAVGPIWGFKQGTAKEIGKEEEDQFLENTVLKSLKMASVKQFKSISFPAISTGVFGFPKDRCAVIMFDAVKSFVEKDSSCTLTEIRFTNFDTGTVKVFEDVFFNKFLSKKEEKKPEDENEKVEETKPPDEEGKSGEVKIEDVKM